MANDAANYENISTKSNLVNYAMSGKYTQWRNYKMRRQRQHVSLHCIAFQKKTMLFMRPTELLTKIINFTCSTNKFYRMKERIDQLRKF